ncbi:three-Cys-motif partner protein TcmP [Thioalkalivibrio sp. HL-Eb18]|uniref:three-Cys-motif partner protein TcmP n=1 Tax=Thioalkalivibrio sp. HL-Eb18 TaxID=1266913 RepID=UPI00036CF089|nr:three-Cys-motif partner protein TcmP [Thioalkalivibrio sp. HL-Eb18]
MSPNRHGGHWTETKLDALEKYLNAYLSILKGNSRAQFLRTHYVDAFAGSTRRANKTSGDRNLPFDEADREEKEAYAAGSVRRALGLAMAFDRYHFAEINPRYCEELQQTIQAEFPERAEQCHVYPLDANEMLEQWVNGLGRLDRGVVFLDPYGMQVRWETIERLGRSQKVDLWMLFPYSAVNRLLRNDRQIDQAWREALDRFFGDGSWEGEFFRESATRDLFDQQPTLERRVDTEGVARYLVRKLKGVFTAVHEPPLVLKNTRGSPLFLLVFAVGNPKAVGAAMKIAGDILKTA